MSAIDYKQFVPDSPNWEDEYAEQMGRVELDDYIERVYRHLHKMKPGAHLDLDKFVRPDNAHLFVKVVCSYIWAGQPAVFSDDYSRVVRLHDELKSCRAYKGVRKRTK